MGTPTLNFNAMSDDELRRETNSNLLLSLRTHPHPALCPRRSHLLDLIRHYEGLWSRFAASHWRISYQEETPPHASEYIMNMVTLTSE